MARKNALIFCYRKNNPTIILPWGRFHRVAFQLFLEIKHLCNIFQQGQRTLFERIQGLFRHTDRHTVFVGKYDFNDCNRGVIDYQFFVFWIIFFQNFQCVFGGVTQQSHIRFVDQNIFKSDITAFADSVKRKFTPFFAHKKNSSSQNLNDFLNSSRIQFLFYTHFRLEIL